MIKSLSEIKLKDHGLIFSKNYDSYLLR